MNYWSVVKRQEKLAQVLQTMTMIEKGELPVVMQTQAERKRAEARVVAVERAVGKFIGRCRRDERRSKKIVARGEY